MNEHLTSQYCHNPYQTDTELNRRKDKCKERDKPSDNNERNIPSTSNDNDTTASRAIEYPWLQTGNTLSSNIIDIIYDKLISWRKNLFLLLSGSSGKRYIEETTRLF